MEPNFKEKSWLTTVFPPQSEKTLFSFSLLLPSSVILIGSILSQTYISPKSSIQRLIILPLSLSIITALNLNIIARKTHPYPSMSYGGGTIAFQMILQSFDLLVFNQRRFVTERFPGWGSCGNITPKSSFTQRLRWAVGLLLAVRGVGWGFEAKRTKHDRENMRKRRITTWSFLMMTLAKLLAIYVVMDLLKTYMSTDLWFRAASHNSFELLPDFNVGLGTVLVRVGLGAITICVAVGVFYNFGAFWGVVLGHSPAESWPPVFDYPTDWTIADFWGGVWHAMFRQFLVAPTRYFTGLSLHARLFIPFFLSSLLHFSGSYVIKSIGFHSLIFFNLQSFAIIAQSYVFGLMPMKIVTEVVDGHGVQKIKQMGNVKRVLVACTTIAWLVITGYGYLEEYARGGMFDVEPVPVSFVRLLLGWDEWSRWDFYFKAE